MEDVEKQLENSLMDESDTGIDLERIEKKYLRGNKQLQPISANELV